MKVGDPQIDFNASVLNHRKSKEVVGFLDKNIVRAEVEKNVV